MTDSVLLTVDDVLVLVAHFRLARNLYVCFSITLPFAFFRCVSATAIGVEAFFSLQILTFFSNFPHHFATLIDVYSARKALFTCRVIFHFLFSQPSCRSDFLPFLFSRFVFLLFHEGFSREK